jgi:hypothetical protein
VKVVGKRQWRSCGPQTTPIMTRYIELLCTLPAEGCQAFRSGAEEQISSLRGDLANRYFRCWVDRMVTLMPWSPWLATSVRPNRS